MSVRARTPEELAVQRAHRHALWEIGDLSWALHGAQLEDEAFREECYARGVRRIVELCGRRYGKTRGLVVDAFQTAIRFPGSRLPYAAKTWDSACAYVIPEARYLIDFAPPSMKPEIVGGEVRFPNKSLIHISGSDTQRNADNLRGPAARRAYVDESGFNDQLEYLTDSILQPQLLTTSGEMVVASSAPLTPKHHFATMVKRAKLRRALIKRTTEDAPHITPAQIEELAQELGGRDSSAYRREVLCEIVTDESRAVIPEWRRHKDVCTAVVPPREYRNFYVSADLGYNDGTAILIGWVDWYGADVNGERTGPRLIVCGEAVLERPTSFDVQRDAAALERTHDATGRVKGRVADAHKITVADLRRLHGKLRDSEGEAAAWRLPRKDDLEGAVNQVRLLVRRHQLVIDPSCTRLLDDINDAVWDSSRTKFEQVSDTWHYDALAALVYLVRTADLTLCPEPELWVPSPARKAHPGDMSQGTLPSGRGGRISLKRTRR